MESEAVEAEAAVRDVSSTDHVQFQSQFHNPKAVMERQHLRAHMELHRSTAVAAEAWRPSRTITIQTCVAMDGFQFPDLRLRMQRAADRRAITAVDQKVTQTADRQVPDRAFHRTTADRLATLTTVDRQDSHKTAGRQDSHKTADLQATRTAVDRQETLPASIPPTAHQDTQAEA